MNQNQIFSYNLGIFFPSTTSLDPSPTPGFSMLSFFRTIECKVAAVIKSIKGSFDKFGEAIDFHYDSLTAQVGAPRRILGCTPIRNFCRNIQFCFSFLQRRLFEMVTWNLKPEKKKSVF